MLTTSAFAQLVPSSISRIIECYRTSDRLALPITLNFLKTSGVDQDLVENLTNQARSRYEERLLSALVLIEIFGNTTFSGRTALISWLSRQQCDDETALRRAAKDFADELKRRDLRMQYT